MTPDSAPANPYSIADLLRVMARLRDPDGGCPWDLAQTFESIVPSTLEECYELADAIECGELDHVAEELGDVLFQVIFYAQLGSEKGAFDFASVVHTLVTKLVRRHPHVFVEGDIEARANVDISSDEVKASWEAIKQAERQQKSQDSVLADIPRALPALPRAQKLQKRAAGVGFDWPELAPVFDKLDEEVGELKDALAQGDSEHVESEFGDLLFTVVNIGRHLKFDSETALRRANYRFEQRFNAMEDAASAEGSSLAAESAEQLEARWESAKRNR